MSFVFPAYPAGEGSWIGGKEPDDAFSRLQIAHENQEISAPQGGVRSGGDNLLPASSDRNHRRARRAPEFQRSEAFSRAVPVLGDTDAVVGKALRRLRGEEAVDFPTSTAIGALSLYISGGSVGDFQPMNINFGIITPLDHRVRGKRNKNAEISARSLQILDGLKQKEVFHL